MPNIIEATTTFSDGDQVTAASLNNLGVCLRDQRRLTEAAALFDEALAMIRGFADGPDDRVAQTLHNLALWPMGAESFSWWWVVNVLTWLAVFLGGAAWRMGRDTARV